AGRGPARRRGPGLGGARGRGRPGARGLRRRPALRGQGDAAQPGEHDRGRHDRGEQERRRRAGAGAAPGARPLPGRALAGGAARLSGSYETLQVTREGHVGWLVFDRPEGGNAMDATMLAELERAWCELADDPAGRVIVNTGSGDAFQTGLDVVQLARDPEALREQSRRTKRAELRITAWHNKVWKPVIAAVNGTCAGGGLHFVADADIVIASTEATFLDPHVSVG